MVQKIIQRIRWLIRSKLFQVVFYTVVLSVILVYGVVSILGDDGQGIDKSFIWEEEFSSEYEKAFRELNIVN